MSESTTTTFHTCQSVRGALVNWSKRDWTRACKWIKKDNGERFRSGDELKEAFLDELAQGREVIPVGSPCEGFCYKNGCPGHPTAGGARES